MKCFQIQFRPDKKQPVLLVVVAEDLDAAFVEAEKLDKDCTISCMASANVVAAKIHAIQGLSQNAPE